MAEIRLIRNKKELDEVFNIRNKVFGEEQKIDRAVDFDRLDNNAKHTIVFYGNKVIGCARIRLIKNRVKLERIAILKEYRGKGFGVELMRYLVSYAKKKKAKEIYFHSQYYIKDFYKKCGFKIRGKPFPEAGVKHIEMYLKLN